MYFWVMYIPIVAIALATTISVLVFIIAKILSTRSRTDREKTSPFECGFDPKNNARVPFSLRFFILAIIFIVFDIEIVLLIPIPIINTIINTIQAETAGIVFLVILLLGLFHE
jgi:NADH-ubiquinone oxidoreductase chain 3